MAFFPQEDTTQDVSGIPANDAMAQLELQRRLKMAQQLQETKAPEGQMVSGHYIAPSWTQYAANAMNKYYGRQAEEQAMKQFGAYQKNKQAQLGDILKGLTQHTEEIPLDTVQTGGAPRIWETQTVKPDLNATIQKMSAYDPNFGAKIAEARIAKMITPKEPVKLGAGEVLLDPNTMQPLYTAPFKPHDNIPTVKTMRVGNNEITKQWNDKTQSWDEIAKGPAFKPNEINNVPSGYRIKPGSTTGELEFIPGGPADPNKTVPLGNRESVFINRIGIAANETAKDLNNIVKLPLTTNRGIFGGRQQGGSLFSAGKESLANTMTTQDVQSYNTLASGLQRNLAAIEAAGLAPSGSLTHQMDAVIFKSGDTNYTKLQKLAQIKQIANAGIETTLSNPRLPEKQVKHFEDVLNQINQAVPFDNSDLLTLQQAHQTNPNVTINDIIKAKQKNTQQSDTRKAADAILGGQ